MNTDVNLKTLLEESISLLPAKVQPAYIALLEVVQPKHYVFLLRAIPTSPEYMHRIDKLRQERRKAHKLNRRKDHVMTDYIYNELEIEVKFQSAEDAFSALDLLQYKVHEYSPYFSKTIYWKSITSYLNEIRGF